jgi:hypothetical protein
MPTIPNLCGASPELDDALTKLEDLESSLTSQIDAAASTAAATAASAATELKASFDSLSIDLPEIPPLNLQAEITGLLQLPLTTLGEVLAYTTKLAEIDTNFGSELTAAGKDLTTLVSDATTALSGGGDLCKAVPNFEKAADGSGEASEKAAAVLQASTAPLAEELSVIVQNPNINASRDVLKTKFEKFTTVANTEGFENLGKAAADFNVPEAYEETIKSREFTVTKNGKSIKTKVVTAIESVIKTTSTDITSSSEKTVVSGGGVTVTRYERANVSKNGQTCQPVLVEELINADGPDAFGNGLAAPAGASIEIILLKHNITEILTIRGWSPSARGGKGGWRPLYSGDTFSNYDNYQIDDDREIGISTEHNGPYAGYTGPINRYLGIAYKVKYKYNATYNPNVKKIEEFL